MSELRNGPLNSLRKSSKLRSHAADLGSMSLRSTLITGVEALEVDTLTFNYRNLNDLYRAADKSMTDFKHRAHSLQTDIDRFAGNTHIKLKSYEAETDYSLDASARDFKAGLSRELAVKQDLKLEVRDLMGELKSLRHQIEETAAQVSYLEDFCGTRKLM